MSVKEIRKRYELVAPDGGWGYVIWIALTINMVASLAFVSCIGMIYNDIYIQLNMDSTSITLLNGIGSLSVSIAGFITGPLMGCMSMRKLGLIAVIFLNVGAFAIVFVNSKGLFFLLNGILQSLGTGVLINLTFTMINQYFVKKRMLTVAVIQTITAVVSLVAPQFVKWSTDEYGCRGTLIFMSGICMHTFLAITLMQPVEWHMKKVEIEIVSEDNDNEIKSLLKHDEAANEKCNTPVATLLVTAEKKESHNNTVKEDVTKRSVFNEMFRDFRDIPFLKSFLLSNASIGLAISAFSDATFMMMLPQALYSMEWSEGRVAWAISLINFGDLVVKVLFILFNSTLLKIGSSEMYIIGLIMVLFTRLGFLWFEDVSVMLVFTFMQGMSRSIMGILYPLVIGDAVDKEKFTSALGIFMLIYGITCLTFGPLIGAIRDLTNSYGTAFYILTSCFGIVIMFWSIELLYKKNKDKRVKTIKGRESA